jgi:hypothetical protein
MLYALTHADLARLYDAPGLELYRPEAVLAKQLEGGSVPALCYNLARAPEPHERNAQYVGRLRDVLTRLGFPSDYVRSIT